ncbi:tetratricopeptide repeat protein [Pseudodesulfovibrio cashew]|uniref:Tetratricopeptide repeat protein n=1 Tax=Pseudodesulfovibrio cashew TaxID=2678688 RepID=A0A6I6JI65_9BACT|nr:response regulator [Pseudodesulfovibrio cashew]QGY39847.1 tetratricopeptide repeat protein [Pseudodesulfovibrio cashew]
MAQATYDNIVRHFLEEENGFIVYLSDDSAFARTLRSIFHRDIGFKGEVLFTYASQEPALRKCRELARDGVPCLIFVERMLGGEPTTDFLIRMGRELPAVPMILLTWEATQETVAYFFELGVARVLVKPVSANTVIQAMAQTLNPPVFLKRLMGRYEERFNNGDFDGALDTADRILLIKPSSVQALVMRGDALMRIGDEDQAVQAYMTAHEAKPMYMAPLIKLASAFRDMEDERALAYLKTLDEMSPLNPERKIDIAEQHLLRNEQEEAEAYLEQGMAVAERETRSMVGDLTTRIVDAVFGVAPELAVKYLYRVIDSKRRLGRDDLTHFNRLGVILRGEGRWEEALEVYEKALGIDREDPAVHYNMGLAYWEGGKRSKALHCFEHALKSDPLFFSSSVGATLNIGLLYYDLRQYHDAEPFFQHALSLDPENRTARKRLDAIRERQGS